MVIKRRRQGHVTQQWLLAAVVVAASVPAVVLAEDRQCCFKQASGSMKPALPAGAVVAAVKYPDDGGPARGDVVVFSLPNSAAVYVKRVVGLAADRIKMADGELYINDQPVKRERVKDFVDHEEGRATPVKRWRETLPNGVSYETLDLVDNGFYDNTPVYSVPPEHYFVLGDNRDNSTDSRVQSQIGYVPASAIIGRAVLQDEPQSP
jgi:signal peptidase I